jgi:hypothetical protein
MRKTIVLPALLALGFAVCVVAQTESDFSGWMKQVAATNGAVKKAVASKDNAAVAMSADTLSGIFGQVAAYFSSHNIADGADKAKAAQKASMDLAAAAKSGDDAKVASAAGAVGGSCAGCHMAHRDGSPGAFKIK